jgi:hypothetical protein
MTTRRLALIVAASHVIGCAEAPGDAIRLAPSTLPLGLVAHYSFDEASGAFILDDSGNRRDAQMTGGTWLSDGRFGGALRFAVGEMASVPGLPKAASGFSVSAWVRLHTFVQTTDDDPGRWGTIVSTEQGLLGGWEVMIDRSQTTPAVNFAFWKGPDQGDFTGWTIANVPLGEWTHVGAVVDKNAQLFEFYVNGVERGRSTTTSGILPGSETLTMGQYPAGGRSLDGDVDEIAIWNRALAAAEMEFLYQHPLPPL